MMNTQSSDQASGPHICSAKQQMRAAQGFTFFSIIAVLTLPLIIPMIIWVAASIFMYAAAACHPNPKVCDFLKYSGYRFYGVFGILVVVLCFFGPLIAKAIGGWIILGSIAWGLSVLIVVPLGIRDIWLASKYNWQDMIVEQDA
jgi:hypothetical protein